jgi:hypothetical protein
MESHTIAESLIMPACKIIVKKDSKDAESEIDEVSVSTNAISRRVDDISQNTEDVFAEILKKILTLLSMSTSQQP